MLKDTGKCSLLLVTFQIIRHCGQSGFSLKIYIYIHIPIPVDVYIKSICINLAGYSPWGCKELDTTEHTCTYIHTHTHTYIKINMFRKNKYIHTCNKSDHTSKCTHYLWD